MSLGHTEVRRDDAWTFDVHRERVGATERVRLIGEMDLSVTGRVDLEMRDAEAGDADRIVLDLGELEFLDASGIRLLLLLNARSKRNGGRLRITGARAPQVQRVIDLTRIGTELPFLD